ncbi:MAG TPA: helix-turn-helix domain-containing protein [Burkholderiales bacterium]|nr:helix-turn-helix domain-containing protein [Burkholderiales bacterium]
MRAIHALDRGLAVLLAISAAGSATLHELHERTGVPKASLLRILVTLKGRGMVWRRISDGRYHAGQRFASRIRYPGRTERLVEAASPVLDELCARIGWPSDLAIPRRDYMEICETNRPRAPIHLNRELVGLKVPMLLTAHGRAYLAFCGDAEREAALARLRASRRRGNDLAHNRAWVARMIEETRAQGYGTRDPGFGGHFHRPKREHNDGLLAIAVPVRVAGRVVATINMVWVERVATPAQLAARHLGDLEAAARRLGETLELTPAAR